jgi:hypothetical protein
MCSLLFILSVANAAELPAPPSDSEYCSYLFQGPVDLWTHGDTIQQLQELKWSPFAPSKDHLVSNNQYKSISPPSGHGRVEQEMITGHPISGRSEWPTKLTKRM